jgi:hypothetical protein
MIMNQPNTARSRRYLVTGNTETCGLSVGDMLVEIRRFEGWDHQGCIDSVRSIMAEMRILIGPRAGESVEITLESGYEYDPPFPSSRPTWLHELVGDEWIA